MLSAPFFGKTGLMNQKKGFPAKSSTIDAGQFEIASCAHLYFPEGSCQHLYVFAAILFMTRLARTAYVLVILKGGSVPYSTSHRRT